MKERYMPGWLIGFVLRYRWVFRWIGGLGFLFGLLLSITGIGVYSGVIEGNFTYEIASIRGLGALIFFPLFVLAFFGWIRGLPGDAKKDWMLKNLPKEEKDKLEVKFELEER